MPKATIQQRFGKVLKRRREALPGDVSQEALAARAGIHRNYVGLLERGRQNPTLVMVEKIAAALGVGVGTLMKEVEAG